MKTTIKAERKHNFSRGRYALLLWFGLGSLTFASMALAQTNRSVRLELQCVGPQNLREVMVTLNNTGNTGTAVVLGTRLGNIYLAKTLSFEARFTEGGKFDNFIYNNPTFTNNTTGREDPWIVPLPAHSSYSVTISGNHFMSASGERMDEAAGISDLQLRLTGSKIEPVNLDMRGLANWEVLIMDMQSTAVAIPDDCQ
jgi:hypothetical protein